MVWGWCTHASGGTDVATDSLCKHVSQSLHLWQLTVKNCEQLQSKKHGVKSQSRCKARYCINPENWQMESIWFKLWQIYLEKKNKTKKERKEKREADSRSLTALCTLHTNCSLKPFMLPPALKTAGRAAHYCRTSNKHWSNAEPLHLLPIPTLTHWANQRVWLKCCPLLLTESEKYTGCSSLQWQCWLKGAGQIPSLPFILSPWNNADMLSKMRKIALDWCALSLSHHWQADFRWQ